MTEPSVSGSGLTGSDQLTGLVEVVDAFRRRQADDGTVPEPAAAAAAAAAADRALLTRILDGALDVFRTRPGGAGQADALTADVRDWLAAGLDSPPNFTRSRDALPAPADGETALFVGPVQTTNSVPPVGRRMELLHVRRREPAALAEFAERFPHPKNNCQSTILLDASAGFRDGNCLVFFPENVATHDKPVGQAYAMFTFNKFRKIHEREAVRVARALLRPDSMPGNSSGLRPELCYNARACWGYLHDYFHYREPWPIDTHLKLKMNWFVGVLEELAVDCRTALACAQRSVPYSDEQFDMIILERIFRYPQAPDATRNFDAATGVLLYSWLRERDALHGDDTLILDRRRTVEAIEDFVAATAKLEDSVADEDAYRTRAKAFVREYLPEGDAGERYRFTPDQRRLLAIQPQLRSQPPLTFAAGEW